MNTRTEKPLSPTIWGRVSIHGKKVWVEVTHFISDNGHWKNRVRTEDGEEHVVPNDSLDFSKKKV